MKVEKVSTKGFFPQYSAVTHELYGSGSYITGCKGEKQITFIASKSEPICLTIQKAVRQFEFLSNNNGLPEYRR
jgi:hypothetical protein